MEKRFFDETNGLWYELGDGYYYPCPTVSEEEKRPISIWGQQHEQYLKEHRQIVYNTLLLSGKLNAYLADIDRQAQEQYELLINQMKQSRGITERSFAQKALTSRHIHRNEISALSSWLLCCCISQC